MKWEDRRQSGNVDDRRGLSGKGKTAIGGGIIGIIILLLSLFGGETGKQIAPILEQVSQSGVMTASGEPRELTAEEKKMGEFVSTVFADTEDVWHTIFKENGKTYVEPKMVLFDDGVNTGCGSATAAVGPFYCPADQTVYMDLAFFNELYNRFGAKKGDFAIAYVIAHEVGHHVQTLLGTSAQVRKQQQQSSQKKANQLSVSQELQADFYAGVWARHIQKYLDPQDIDIALSAANAVGDDAIQRKMQGSVNPDSFTHGTSEQRKYWFMKGYETGDISQGDTFNNNK